MSGLYISYRQSDSPGPAAAVAMQLSREYGRSRVFIDGEPDPLLAVPHDANQEALDSLPARNLATACVMLAIVGPGWLATDASGRSSLFQPEDYVRLELATALELHLRIIPVFVGGATGWPDREDIPEALAGLLAHDGMRLRTDRFEIDLQGVSALLARTMAAHAYEPTAEDLLHPALGFTPITLGSGAALGAFEALRLQTRYEQVRQSLGKTRSVSAFAHRNRVCHDAFAPIVDKVRFQLAPDLSPALERAARTACRLKPFQSIIAAADLSFLRWGRAGLIVTDAGLYHYGDGGPATFFPNAVLAAATVERAGEQAIRIGAQQISLPARIDASHVLGFVQAAVRVAQEAPVSAAAR